MISERLQIQNLIKALNELEKLKLLLFDKNQYVLFEHIPKPILMEKTSIFGINSKSLGAQAENFLLTNGSSFWSKQQNLQMKEEHFEKALNAVKNKATPNVIDQRLIEIMEDFGS